MQLVEQIARALAEAAGLDWDAMPENKTDDVPADECRETYRCLAQAVLPFIAAERERCAMVAYATCAETRHVTLGDKVAAAIRSQP